MPEQTPENILAVVQEVLADILERDPETITLHESFTDLEIDSLSLIEAVEALEEHFNSAIRFEDEELAELKNVHDAVDLIQRKLGETK